MAPEPELDQGFNFGIHMQSYTQPPPLEPLLGIFSSRVGRSQHRAHAETLTEDNVASPNRSQLPRARDASTNQLAAK
jgi:hypothetical protein